MNIFLCLFFILIRKIANILYYYGERWLSAIYATLRIGCLKLNYDISYNLHIPDINPSCLCGAKLETVNHFLMHCKHYADQRQILKAKVEAITKFKYETILYGTDTISLQENKLVFDAVHEFILETLRFI